MSNESYIIQVIDPGGAGKSTSLNMLKQKIIKPNETDEDQDVEDQTDTTTI